ncbi:hypothetical protein BaRGS_00032715, partial [Batillaria attramentaria]
MDKTRLISCLAKRYTLREFAAQNLTGLHYRELALAAERRTGHENEAALGQVE